MLCKRCSNIHFRRLAECDLFNEEPDWLPLADNRSGSVFYILHRSKDALRDSSESGCHFCAMILDRLFGEGGHSGFRSREIWARGEVVFRRTLVDNWRRGDSFEQWNVDDWIYVQCEDRNITTTWHGRQGYSGKLQMSCGFCILMDSGTVGRMLDALLNCHATTSLEDQTSNLLRSSLPATVEEMPEAELSGISPQLLHLDASLYSPWLDVSTLSLTNMFLAAVWLQKCTLKHKVCTELQVAGKLPSRVINITNPSRPVLDEGSNREEPYITLSYK